jgi:tetratricopeptide (TPR) repeat protein
VKSWALTWLACLPLPAASGGDSQSPPPATPAVEPVPRLATPEQQFQLAVRLKQSLRGKLGRERESLLLQAVAAYRAVREHHPLQRGLGAEAAFRAGELLRSADRAEACLVEFEFARELGARTPFRARAVLEIGHVHRRAGRHREALDAYLALAADATSAGTWREDAELWAGRIYALQGRVEEAHRLFERLAGKAADAVTRIEAFDELALAYVDANDLEAAAGELARCREALSDEALEETELGERVRSALQWMRSIPRLEQAIRARASGVPIQRRADREVGREVRRER